jgi:hypothetical protein
VENGDAAVAKDKQTLPAASGEQHALVQLIRKAEAGDAKALREVRALAETRLAGLWAEYGNVARTAERTLVNVAAGENVLMREAIARRLEAMREELLGPSPSPLERLLVERVTLCWLQTHYEDAADAAGLKKGVSWTQSLNQQKRVEGAQRRLLSAVKTLATVRRLALPMLQVNIAEKQINVAQGSSRSELGDGLEIPE